MSHTYAKKAVRPSSTTSLSTPVFGFVTFTVCESFGIVSKNFSICLNCAELSCSKNSLSSFLVQSEAVQDSSSLKTCSIQTEIRSNALDGYKRQPLKLVFINSDIDGYFILKVSSVSSLISLLCSFDLITLISSRLIKVGT